jgi:hypothetical protein
MTREGDMLLEKRRRFLVAGKTGARFLKSLLFAVHFFRVPPCLIAGSRRASTRPPFAAALVSARR